MHADKPAESVAAVVRDFIEQELVYGGEGNFDQDADLIERGVIDSMSLLRLVSFLEDRYHIEIQDEDLVPDNFRSVGAIKSFVTRRLGTSRDS